MSMWKKVLLIDGGAALIVGVLIILINEKLTLWLALPLELLNFMAIVNLLYSIFSLTLAFFKKPSLILLKVLVAANLFWSFNCMRLALIYDESSNWLGIVYLIGEAIFVGALACLEWRWRRMLVTTNNYKTADTN